MRRIMLAVLACLALSSCDPLHGAMTGLRHTMPRNDETKCPYCLQEVGAFEKQCPYCGKRIAFDLGEAKS